MSSIVTSIAMVTQTIVGNAGATILTTLPPAPTSTKAAAASIFDPSHPNPVDFDSTNPLILFIVQAFVIVALSRLLAFFLGKIRQPRVIAEVIAGILIGPSVFGRIPHFTARIFPSPSIPYLSLVANIGLVLFLFLVGLETDFSLFRRNFKASVSISLIGMVVPFALGAAVSKGIYEEFVKTESVNFGTFLLFIGVANAITAFPVLARILTELEMLQNHVGVIVLAAGVGNDVVGWVLLALAIALVNASNGIIVLYVILTAIGWILALWFLGRPLLVWLGAKTNSYGEKGPSQSMTCAVLFLVLASAWVTDRIGIHAIFGGFLVGLIVPMEIRAPLTEKIEDLVSVLFLPLYFALSGLKTDLGLLANGSIWGWCICVIVVAFFSKFLSCGLVAKLNGMDWRESGAVGSLMACKGLVELIVLNIGLNAGILNPEVFAIFVTMALVTTFLTTPLALAFYPKSYRLQTERARRGQGEVFPASSTDDGDDKTRSRFAIVLEQFDHLPAVFAFCKLVKAPIQFDSTTTTRDSSIDEKTPYDASTRFTPVSIAALRLIELSERTSALLKASENEQTLLKADSLTRIFQSFALGIGIKTTTSLSIAGQDTYSSLVASHAAEHSSDMIILPWALQGAKVEEGVAATYLPNPFESMFKRSGSAGSPQYASFVRKVFADASCDVALYLDRGIEPDSASLLSGRAHVFFAFHGGTDDRACLALVVQLVLQNQGLTATIVRVERAAEPTSDDRALSTKQTTRGGSAGVSEAETPVLFSQLTVHGGGGATDTVYPTQHNLGSETADNLALSHFFDQSSTPRPKSLTDALTRITYSTLSTIQPLHLSVARARVTSTSTSTPLILIAGRSRRDAPSHSTELATFLKSNLEAVQSGIANSSEVRRSLGDLGVAYLVAGVGTSLLVVQSAAGGGALKPKGA